MVPYTSNVNCIQNKFLKIAICILVNLIERIKNVLPFHIKEITVFLKKREPNYSFTFMLL